MRTRRSQNVAPDAVSFISGEYRQYSSASGMSAISDTNGARLKPLRSQVEQNCGKA
jgi:hypothetical protein